MSYRSALNAIYDLLNLNTEFAFLRRLYQSPIQIGDLWPKKTAAWKTRTEDVLYTRHNFKQ